MQRKNPRDIAESLAFIIEHMATKEEVATKEDVREINGRLDSLEDRLGAVENKLTGLYRMHEAEGMKQQDLKLARRIHDLEEKLYGAGKSRHPKHLPLP
jgi:hypothetical protein